MLGQSFQSKQLKTMMIADVISNCPVFSRCRKSAYIRIWAILNH